MGLFKRAISVTSINFSCWLRDIRVRFIMIMTILVIANMMSPLVSYGLDNGARSTPLVLALLFGSEESSIASSKTVLHIGLILLLCDAPFYYPITPYAIMRSRRPGWCLGSCMYIALVSLVYIAFISLCSSLMSIPVISFTDSWNGAAADLTYGTAQFSAGELSVYYPQHFPKEVVMYTYPSGAMLYTLLTCWASFTFLGLLMYLLSLLTQNVLWGLGAAGLIVLIDPVINWFSYPNRYWLQLFSPVTWTSVKDLNIVQSRRWLSVPYVAGMYALLIALLTIAIWYVSRHIMIARLQTNE